MDAQQNERLYRDCCDDGSLAQVGAFEQLWAICYRTAFGMLYAQPDAADAAADCAQLALVKIQRSLPQCQNPDRFVSWACQIVRRTVLDELRRPARRLRDGLAAVEEHVAPVGEPAPEAEAADLAALLREAIARGGLSPRSQRVVAGRYFHEQPDEQLAAAERALSGEPVLPSHIQVTRSKNLAKLRGNAALIERLRGHIDL